MIHIVIPMAGAGSRFQTAGYTVPKPFIEVNGKMIIEHVLDGAYTEQADYTLIIQKSFQEAQAAQLETIRKNYDCQFVTVERLTQGASCTALAAYEKINDMNPTVFVDSDNFFDSRAFQSFLADGPARHLDGNLLTFNTLEPCFSYVALDNQGYAVQTKEKEPISNHAIVGAYWFARGKDFVKQAINMLIYGDKVKQEYYMSNVYNWAIRAGLKVGCFDIKANEWACVGTPEQLKKYLTIHK